MPFQASAKAPEAEVPTALQAVAEMHDMAVSWVVWPTGLGVGWIAQRAPFQALSERPLSPGVVDREPTAVHAVFDLQDPPQEFLSWLLCVLHGEAAGDGCFGIVWLASRDHDRGNHDDTAGIEHRSDLPVR